MCKNNYFEVKMIDFESQTCLAYKKGHTFLVDYKYLDHNSIIWILLNKYQKMAEYETPISTYSSGLFSRTR